jgi:hypothetical protein
MHINWSGLGEVFGISLGAGVGVVVLFSLGISALGRRESATAEGQSSTAPTAIAAVCFLACVAVVGYGLYLVIVK